MNKNILAQDEQPFKIPNHWQWTILDRIANWGSGGTPSKKHSEYYDGDIHWIKTGELNNDYIYDSEDRITLNGLKNSSAKLYPINTVIVAMYGATVGKVGILGIEAATNQACACAICNSNIHFKYLFYYLISQKDTFILISRGTAQPNISQSIIKNYSIPLPPLDEQKRIVAIIDSLFEKLDKAKAIAQNVVDGYELRRGKILYDTFKRLDCERSKIGDVCEFIGGGTPSKKIDEYWNGDIPWASVKDVKGNYLFKTIDKITELGLKNSSANLCEVDDLLLVTRMAPGKTIISKIVTAINQDLKIIKSDMPSKYLYYYFNYIRRDIENKSRGTTVNGIKVETIKELEIPIPGIEEQKEIVRHLDSLLTKEQQTKELAESVLNRIEKMKKKILGMAFRGILTQNIQLG